jgi:hypothetical protein
MGACILDVTPRKRFMWTESKAIGKDDLTGDRRNHGRSFSGRAQKRLTAQLSDGGAVRRCKVG